MSARLRPVAAFSTSTSPAAGSGSGTSPSTGTPPPSSPFGRTARTTSATPGGDGFRSLRDLRRGGRASGVEMLGQRLDAALEPDMTAVQHSHRNPVLARVIVGPQLAQQAHHLTT